MGSTRDLFKKDRDTKGTFHVKMGTVKDRNDMDLIEPEDIKKGDKNTQNYTKKKNKSIMTWITTMITHQETDILECKATWPLGSITMNC